MAGLGARGEPAACEAGLECVASVTAPNFESLKINRFATPSDDREVTLLRRSAANEERGPGMKTLGTILLGSVAGLVLIGAAQAADLPTKKEPVAPPPANCYASFMTWLDSTATDCPLSYMGVTVYGAIDMGFGYETHATPFNGAYPNGVQEEIYKTSNGARWQLVPNGLTQSNIGVKIKEQIAPNWYIVGDVNAGFDPYSMRFANGPQSAAENNYTYLYQQTANGDSSRTWGWDNSRAYIGVNNTTLGTLTFGRQYAFTNDASANYDPFGGAYAFSLIGTTGTPVAGTGETETARYDTSVKYQVAYNGFRAGGLVQVGGWQQGNGAQQAAQVDLGADFYGFSVDAIYAYAQDAVKLATYGSIATDGVTAGYPTDTLQATLANVNAVVIGGKYKWNALTLYGGYAYDRLSDPSNPYGATPTANGDYFSSLNGGFPGIVQKLAYVTPEDLQTLWLGAKYGVLSNLDVAVAYYYEWQNNYTNVNSGYNVPYTWVAGSKPGTLTAAKGGVPCGPNQQQPAPGATPQGSDSSSCAGTTNVVGAMIDWRPVKRVDLYAGLMYSVVAGGMASGYINNNNTAFTAGVKLAF